MLRLTAILLVWTFLVPAPQTNPVPASLAGRWRLTDVVAPNAAPELFVSLEPSSRLSIQRRFTTGVQYIHFSVGTITRSGERVFQSSTDRAYANTAIVRDRSLVLNTLTAIDGPASKSAGHEETWTVTSADLLVVDVIDRPVGGAPQTRRLTYRRIPRPASVVPGTNLVDNGNADAGLSYWWASGGAAAIDPCDGNKCFALSGAAEFHQQVLLPSDAAGKFVVLVGSASMDLINVDRNISGRPSLYGIVGAEDGYRVVAHLQGQNLGARATMAHEWVPVSGVFKLPEDSFVVSLQLKRGSVRGVPDNGSVARFDDLGVYVFATETDARSFAASWRGRTR